MHQKAAHFTIPLFIPMQGCPFDCVFCNQRSITGRHQAPTDAEITEKIENHLLTISKSRGHIEIGFFGGSFTGLPVELQEHYLSLVQPWIKSGKVSGLRLSTRPDYIDNEILNRLRRYNVTTIEIGVQSMDNEVLRLSGRGHTTDNVRRASKQILAAGFSSGLQMMIGLPGDTFEKSMNTAKEIVSMGAQETRIYPALVIRNTNLESMFHSGRYKPLSPDEAIEWCRHIVPVFEKAGVKILRLGLHPSEGLLNNNDLVAGPFHVAFGELVYSRIWNQLLSVISPNPDVAITIFLNSTQINQAVGHGGTNKKMLEGRFKKVSFKGDISITGRDFYVYYR